MFVSVIGFVLVLSVSVSRATGNKNEALKDKLARSLTHVREMLVDMEHKVEQERKTLAQIDRNLIQKEEGGGVVDKNYSDNITTAAQGNSNDTITLKTTPSLFPRPTTFATLPSNNATSLFIADIEQNMALNRHGYFIAFAEKIMELIYTKSEEEVYSVVHHVAVLMHKNVKGGTFKSLGVDIIGGLEGKLAWFESLSPKQIKEQAGVLHFMLKVLDKSLDADVTSLLRFYDKMFTKEEGQELFESLESFYKYAEVEGKNAFESIGERIYDAMFAPYFKSEGTRKQKRLIQLILMAAHSVDPHFRAQKMPFLKNSDTDANHSMKDHNQSAFPERRSINYKKIVKHFLVKHPKLLRKIKRQYKHDKKNKHHRFSHTQKRHNNYRESRRHQRRDQLYDREQTSQMAYTGSSYEPENEEVEADSSESGAYYRENSKTNQQKQQSAKQKQRNILKGTRASTKPYLSQYLKQLAIRLLRNKQQRRNFYRNRRFNIPSSQDDFCNHSQNVQDSIENHMLHKIREASSYSDEEYHLRNNLYDALRHGNRTFVSFRKSDGGVNNKQTLMALSSETDDEWVLKNNIYKVFEQEKK